MPIDAVIRHSDEERLGWTKKVKANIWASKTKPSSGPILILVVMVVVVVVVVVVMSASSKKNQKKNNNDELLFKVYAHTFHI